VNPMKKTLLFSLLLLGFLVGTGQVFAQWTTQSISLRPGWNAVYLEVQPEPRDVATVFAGLQMESVWMWNRRYDSVQFLVNPAELLPGNPNWLNYIAAAPPLDGESALHSILGGRCYLIRLAATAPVTNWQVQGQPVVPAANWLADSLNFVGFGVSSTTPPTFQQFFQSSPAHQNTLRFRLDALGRWQRLSNPSTLMAAGEAFWVRSDGASDFTGPVQVRPALGTRIDFGRTLVEQKVVLRNRTTATRTVEVRQLASQSPPAGLPTLAGPVPLSYWNDQTRATYGWSDFPAVLSLSLAPGEEKTLRLAIRRTAMAAAPAGDSTALYQSLLEVRDSGFCRCVIPVIASGLQATTTAASGGRAPSPNLRAGLWVGSAVIDKVSQPTHPSDSNSPRPTGSEAQFRLIVHVGDDGQASLLQQVTLMWKDGARDSEGAIIEPGRQVLVTDDAVIDSLGLTGSALRDGEVVGRRISSACFAFTTPQPMSPPGGFGAVGTPLVCNVSMGYNEPLNPFKHRFHPDHNNLTDDYRSIKPEGDESYSFTRQVRLNFTATDPSDLATPGWGDNQLGGIYEETLLGVHRDPIRIRGSFRLHQASRIGLLNDGL